MSPNDQAQKTGLAELVETLKLEDLRNKAHSECIAFEHAADRQESEALAIEYDNASVLFDDIAIALDAIINFATRDSKC